jgi:hypothetical protein
MRWTRCGATDVAPRAPANQRRGRKGEDSALFVGRVEINLPSLVPTEGATPGKPDDDVVDADFEVVADNKEKS